MPNKQYDTSKFEEALKDLDRWLLISVDELNSNGIPERVRVKDKTIGLYFSIFDGFIYNDEDYYLPIDRVVVHEFKDSIYIKTKDQKIMEVLSEYS